MNRKLIQLTLAGVLLIAGIAGASDNMKVDGMTADDIINKYIEARGGRAAWDKVKTAKMVGKMSMPSQGMELPVMIEYKRPTMVRLELSFQGQTMVQAYDGNTGWAIMPMLGKPDPEEMADDQLKQILDQADFDGPLVDYAAKGHSVELLGKEEIEGTEAYKLRITKKNGDEITSFIESESFIEFRNESMQNIQGVEAEMANTFGDYKDVDGLILPHSIEVSMGGPAMQVITIDRVELGVDIPDQRFAMPAKSEEGAGDEGTE